MSRIVYVCPKCGADIQEICLTSLPPQQKMVCTKCDWSYTKPRSDFGEEIRVPFPTENDTNDFYVNAVLNYNDTGIAYNDAGVDYMMNHTTTDIEYIPYDRATGERLC
jgi:rubredoxin